MTDQILNCPLCEGRCTVPGAQDIKPAAVPPEIVEVVCPECKGTGKANALV
jgi:hypothetical protein